MCISNDHIWAKWKKCVHIALYSCCRGLAGKSLWKKNHWEIAFKEIWGRENVIILTGNNIATEYNYVIPKLHDYVLGNLKGSKNLKCSLETFRIIPNQKVSISGYSGSSYIVQFSFLTIFCCHTLTFELIRGKTILAKKKWENLKEAHSVTFPSFRIWLNVKKVFNDLSSQGSKLLVWWAFSFFELTIITLNALQIVTLGFLWLKKTLPYRSVKR